MDTREKMKNFREQRGLSKKKMADRCNVSEILLGMVEGGSTTNPGIVKRIQEEYKLTDLEAEELLPVNRRPHGGQYEPDKFASRDFENLRGTRKEEA